jgi:hypothetical protein
MTPKWLSLDFHMVNVQIKIRWTFPISGRKWRIQSPKSFPSFPIFHANPIPHYLHYLLYIYICNKCIFPVQSQFFMPKASDFSLTPRWMPLQGVCLRKDGADPRPGGLGGLARAVGAGGEVTPSMEFILFIYIYVCMYVYICIPIISYHVISYHVIA